MSSFIETSVADLKVQVRDGVKRLSLTEDELQLIDASVERQTQWLLELSVASGARIAELKKLIRGEKAIFSNLAAAKASKARNVVINVLAAGLNRAVKVLIAG